MDDYGPDPTLDDDEWDGYPEFTDLVETPVKHAGAWLTDLTEHDLDLLHAGLIHVSTYSYESVEDLLHKLTEARARLRQERSR